MTYDWPTKPSNNKGKEKHKILSTFGEFRGKGQGDGLAFLHSGSDIPETGRKLKVFSPDVGLVRRFGQAANGNPSAGETGPIRIGHFAFNHIKTHLARPGKYGLPADLKIYVVEEGATVFLIDKEAIQKENKRLKDLAKKNKTKYVPIKTVAQLTDKLVKTAKKKVGKNPRIGLRRITKDRYERVTFYPRTKPIGMNVGPTDLHMIYYRTPDGPITDRFNFRNPLAVMKNYVNKQLPEIGEVGLYANDKTEGLILKLEKVGDSGKLTTAMNGVNFKALAFSKFANICGIYQLDYEISNDDGQTTGRSLMWKFDQLPTNRQSRLIIDQNLSTFPAPKAYNKKSIKRTVYRFTRSIGGVINKRNHFALEDVTKWSDGNYTLLIWVQNIAKSNGVGVAPAVNEVKYCYSFSVRTTGNKKTREITVTKIPTIVEVNNKAVTFVNGKMVFKKSGEKVNKQQKEFKFKSESLKVLKKVGRLDEFPPKSILRSNQLIPGK